MRDLISYWHGWEGEKENKNIELALRYNVEYALYCKQGSCADFVASRKLFLSFNVDVDKSVPENCLFSGEESVNVCEGAEVGVPM